MRLSKQRLVTPILISVFAIALSLGGGVELLSV